MTGADFGEIGLGGRFWAKSNPRTLFRVISLKNWVKWGSEGSNFGFLGLQGQFWATKLRLVDSTIESAIVRHALRNISGFGLERIGPPRPEVQCKT